MQIVFNSILPKYLTKDEVKYSELYLRENIHFDKHKNYLINANSGYGKTSFLNLIFGINLDYHGEIFYDGNQLSREKIQKLRINEISYVFQDFKLFPKLTALENILLKNNLTKHKSVEEITDMLKQCNLYVKKDSLLMNQSRGQKQRVAIIRSLCQPYKILMLDEPFSHLDLDNIKKVVNLIKSDLKLKQASMIITDLKKNSLFDYDKTYNL